MHDSARLNQIPSNFKLLNHLFSWEYLTKHFCSEFFFPILKKKENFPGNLLSTVYSNKYFSFAEKVISFKCFFLMFVYLS